MRIEEVLELARKGGKFRRPSMGKAYITYARVAEDGRTPVFTPRLILVVGGMNNMLFTLSNMDLTATDWEDAEPIIKVKMFASAFKIECPDCGRNYQVGEKWELRVGDIYKCTCGNKLLLEPPVLVSPTGAATPVSGCKLMSDKVREDIVNTIDQWPRA